MSNQSHLTSTHESRQGGKRQARFNDKVVSMDSYLPLNLANMHWVYYQHPSGRIHRINDKEYNFIRKLVDEGWVKVTKPADPTYQSIS